MSWCPTCKRYMFWSETHVCPPSFECGVYDLRDEPGERVYESGAEAAAERFAVDKCYEGTEITEVFVRDGNRIVRFEVTIEMEPVATAVELESFDDDEEE